MLGLPPAFAGVDPTYEWRLPAGACGGHRQAPPLRL